MVPSTPTTRTRAPAGSSGPETFHTPSPSLALPEPCSIASTSTSSLPTYCWPRWLRFGCSMACGWRLAIAAEQQQRNDAEHAEADELPLPGNRNDHQQQPDDRCRRGEPDGDSARYQGLRRRQQHGEHHPMPPLQVLQEVTHGCPLRLVNAAAVCAAPRAIPAAVRSAGAALRPWRARRCRPAHLTSRRTPSAS